MRNRHNRKTIAALFKRIPPTALGYLGFLGSEQTLETAEDTCTKRIVPRQNSVDYVGTFLAKFGLRLLSVTSFGIMPLNPKTLNIYTPETLNPENPLIPA